MVDVAIIGGGLSGLSVGAALTKRGAKVAILERMAIGAGASGNIGGNVVPFISRGDDERSVFYDKAFRFASSLLPALDGVVLGKFGAVQFPSTVKLERYMEENSRERIDPNLISSLSGVNVESYALYFKEAFSVSPINVCEALSQLVSKSGSVETNFSAEKISRDKAGWKIDGASKSLRCDKLVIANAFDCLRFDQTSWIPTERVRGELVYVAATSSTKPLKTILCYDGYFLPEINGVHLLGATFDHDFLNPEFSPSRELRMRESLLKWAPSITLGQRVGGRVSFRATTHDRLPYVGNVPEVPIGADSEWFLNSTDTDTAKGLYVSVGHGSRGLLSCLYSGEVLSSIIEEDRASRDSETEQLLSPLRAFKWRGNGGKLPGERNRRTQLAHS